MSTTRAGRETTLDAPMERRIPMPYEEWLAWDGSDAQSEWVDGEAIAFMPPTVRHQEIATFLAALLLFYVRLRNLGRVAVSPIEMWLGSHASREPDVVFVSNARNDRVTEQRIVGGADLAIEIVSDDSVHRDRVAKFAEYAMAGVREYWMFDPRRGTERFDAFALDAHQTYQPLGLDDEGRLRSRVVEGFWIRPEWLLQDPLPDPLACLREIVPDAF